MRKSLYYLFGLMLMSCIVLGQPGNPSNPTPIDGGLVLLALAGLALGREKLKQRA